MTMTRSNEFLRIRAIAFSLSIFLSAIWILLLALDVTSADTKSNLAHLATSSYLIGVNGLAVLSVSIFGLVDMADTVEDCHWTSYVVSELVWIALFALLYLTGAITVTMLTPGFRCRTSENDPFIWCRRLNQVVLISSWFQASLFISYFVYFATISFLAARHSRSVWRTPVRFVNWDYKASPMPTLEDAEDVKTMPNWLKPSNPTVDVASGRIAARDGGVARYSWALLTTPFVWPLRDSVIQASTSTATPAPAPASAPAPAPAPIPAPAPAPQRVQQRDPPRPVQRKSVPVEYAMPIHPRPDELLDAQGPNVPRSGTPDSLPPPPRSRAPREPAPARLSTSTTYSRSSTVRDSTVPLPNPYGSPPRQSSLPSSVYSRQSTVVSGSPNRQWSIPSSIHTVQSGVPSSSSSRQSSVLSSAPSRQSTLASSSLHSHPSARAHPVPPLPVTVPSSIHTWETILPPDHHQSRTVEPLSSSQQEQHARSKSYTAAPSQPRESVSWRSASAKAYSQQRRPSLAVSVSSYATVTQEAVPPLPSRVPPSSGTQSQPRTPITPTTPQSAAPRRGVLKKPNPNWFMQ